MTRFATAKKFDEEITFDELQTDISGFEALSRLLKQGSGIHLPNNPKNRCLMASRLLPLLKHYQLTSYHSYAQLLQARGASAQQEFISALTTNTTQFFREPKHFDTLRSYLKEIASQKGRPRELRVWCGAASTGQEPYTIGMIIMESLPDWSNWSIKILATDIDHEVLQKAAAATYSATEIASVPALYRQKYVRSTRNEKFFQISSNLRRMITFAPFNLLNSTYDFKFPFDIIFCRNVLIYFDPPTSVAVVQKLIDKLAPNGLLFLGHSESSAVKSNHVKHEAPAVYRKNVASDPSPMGRAKGAR